MLKNNLKKGFLVNSLFLFSLIVIYGLVSVLSTDDYSTGSFEQDTDNDPISIVALLDQEDVVRPNVNVEFYATVYDIDNDSAEITVTLWYSNDTFTVYNISQSIVFSSNPAVNQYRFTYNFTGQADGVYLQYYYTAFDGNTTARKDNSGLFYDIEWRKVGAGGSPRGDEDIPIGSRPTITVKPDFIVAVAVVALLVAITLGGYSYQQKRKYKYHHISFPTIIQDKRVVGGILLALTFTVVLSSSYATYTTFKYPGATLDWKIDKMGLVGLERVTSTYDIYNGKGYRYYYVENDSEYDRISWKRVDTTEFETDMTYEILKTFYLGELSLEDALWIQTTIRSSEIAIRKVSLYTVGGLLMHGYDVAPRMKNTYDTFIYTSEIKNRLIDDGFIIRYYGSYEYDNTLRNIFLNILFTLKIIK